MDINNQVQPQNQNAMPPAMQDVPVLITDVGKYARKKYFKNFLIATLIAIIIESFLFYFMLKQFSVDPNLLVIPIISIFAYYFYLRQKVEDAFFQQFAILNGFDFQKYGLPENLNGSLFSIGHSYTGLDLVNGKFLDTQCILFNYQYTVGEGKSSHTYNYTISRMDYSSSLAPIFLRAKGHMFGGTLSKDISRDDKERVTLEGDFDKYFDLWTEKGFELEALQVFTPDFMEQMQTNWKTFSLEFKNNQIYIYAHHMITKDDELENMYKLAKYLVSKITPLAKKMKGDITAMEEQYKK